MGKTGSLEVVQGVGVGAAGLGWGQWVLVLDGVLTAVGSTPGKKGMVTRLRKMLKVYPEFGHDGPEQ